MLSSSSASPPSSSSSSLLLLGVAHFEWKSIKRKIPRLKSRSKILAHTHTQESVWNYVKIVDDDTL
jgi:hypothetical protein